jgi:methionyl-tRNA formyltransferase
MIMDTGTDTGPILLQDSIPIETTETGQTLHDKLAPLGAILLIHTLDWLLAGSIQPHPQPENGALITFAPVLQKENGHIVWTDSAVEIDRQVRAYTPWPGTYTTWNGKRLKILEGYPMKTKGESAASPGEVCDVRGTRYEITSPFAIGTGNGLYAPARLQLEGRQATDPAAFLNGAPEFIGTTLGA